jgi:polyisoprenoid-binding protein YceI
MKIIKQLFPLVPAFLFLGCSNPADNVPEASVRAASTNEVADAGEPAGDNARTFVVAPPLSTINWAGSKVTGSHDGGFNQFVGELRVVDGKLADTGNKVVIDADSIWSDNDRLTSHLKSPDFFDVKTFPTATFVTTSVDSSKTPATVTGNLTMHGLTKEISFPATIQVSEEEVALTAEFFINRFDFEMKYSGKADDLIRKEVVLKLNVKATPGKADFEAMKPAAETASSQTGSREVLDSVTGA